MNYKRMNHTLFNTLFQGISHTLSRYILGIIFILTIVAATSMQCHAVTVTASPNPATVNQTVTFTVNFGSTGCDIHMDFGEGAGLQFVGSAIGGPIFTTTHTYASAGTYSVAAWADIGTCGTPSGPNPSLPLTLNVINPAVPPSLNTIGRFSIDRIELKFKNKRPQITVKQNDPDLGLEAKINFTGTGLLKGYWEVDGFQRSRVFKHLAIGPNITFKYPRIPSLPTLTPGHHTVRFVITQPTLNITFPKALYFVENTKFIKERPIKLIHPQKNQSVLFEPLVFNWQAIPNVKHYLVTLLPDEKKKSKTRPEPIYSAYTEKTEYRLSNRVLQSRFFPGKSYQWLVKGLNRQNEVIGQSKSQSFIFEKQAAFVPGHVLLLTDLTLEGDGAIASFIRQFGLTLLEQYELVSLKKKVTLCHTDDDIFTIIQHARKAPHILSAQPDYIFRTLAEPMSSLQDLTRLLHLDTLPESLTGKGVHVGIVDSGVDLDHKDFQSAIATHENFLTGSEYAPEIHGTAVAGLIGARENEFGIKGVAPGTRLMVLRACRQVNKDHPAGECYTHAVIKALDKGIVQGAKIINMSLGAPVEDPLMTDVISAGAKKGIFFVAPAGNLKSIRFLSFPASHPMVISVAGTTKDGAFYPNQTIGEKADFCAPCKQLFTTIPDHRHNFLDGTSMSSAVVSGIIALACENNPDFSLSHLNPFKGDLKALISHFKTE